MNAKPVHIVFTTIFAPDVLESLRDNLEHHGHLEQAKVWMVGDHKTPAEAARMAEVSTKGGLECRYLDIAAQDDWGARVPEFYGRLPYNNETRRNIGYLCALEEGCELLVSIDDDNYPTVGDFLGGHMQTGRSCAGAVWHEQSGYHNICEHLEFSPQRMIYPRGYPFDHRDQRNRPTTGMPAGDARVGATAGLWLLEPDVDATTWLNGRVSGTAFHGPEQCVLSQDTWSPVNTQNTSVVRDLVPAYLCVPMGYAVPGGRIQRYGDIWGGYFLQAAMQGTCYHLAFGAPIAEHRRRTHSYVDDLRQEYWGMMLTDWLLQQLRADYRCAATATVDRMDALAEFLRTVALPKLPGWCPREVEAFLGWTAENIAAWTVACRRLGA